MELQENEMLVKYWNCKKKKKKKIVNIFLDLMLVLQYKLHLIE